LKEPTNGTTDPSAKAAIISTLQQPPMISNKAPEYPTSSKSGPKNWDKVAADFSKKSSNASKKSQEKSNKENQNTDSSTKDASASDDDDKIDSDDESGDAVDSFFKKIYKDADPDTRRAMMKSFQESNGTALSTNWAEVGKKRVEVVESSKDD
jgi:suppressor of G2 allele of SKP1